MLGHLDADEPREHVRRATRCPWHDDADRLHWIGLGLAVRAQACPEQERAENLPECHGAPLGAKYDYSVGSMLAISESRFSLGCFIDEIDQRDELCVRHGGS